VPPGYDPLTPFGSYAPLTAGIPHIRPTGFEGLPGFGGGMLGTTAAYLMQIFGAGAMAPFGMVPGGFSTQRNVFDIMQQQRIDRMLQDTIQRSAYLDMPNYMQTFRGMAAMTGTEWGGRTQMFAQQAAGGLAGAAPLLAAIAPEFLDAMGGTRGSAAVMAGQIALGGRYRFDPTTGRLGMGAESAQAMTASIYGDLFAGNRFQQMSGLSAGQTGMLFDELSRRGVMPGAAPGMPGTEGLNADQLRNFNADRVKSTLREYSQAVVAIRDIFGEVGRGGAPMAELLDNLQALTGGGMGQLGGSQLASLARGNFNAANMSGIGMNGLFGMMASGGAMANMLRLNPIFAAQSAGAAATFAGAWNAAGGGQGGAFGQYDVNRAAARYQANVMGANASEQAVALGNLLRLEEGGLLDKNSEASRLAQSVMAGNTTFNGQPIQFTKSQLIGMAAAGMPGATPGQLAGMFDRSEAAQPYIFRYNLAAGIVQPNQRAMALDPELLKAGRPQLTAQLGLEGKAADQVMRQALADLRDLAPGENNEAGVTQILRRSLATSMGRGENDDEIKRAAAAVYGRFLERVPQVIRGGTFHGELALTSTSVDAARRRMALEVEMRGGQQEALSMARQGEFGRRFVDTLQRADFAAEGGMGRFLSEVMGGVPVERLEEEKRQQLSNSAKEMRKAMTGLDEAQRRLINNPNDPTARKAVRDAQRVLSEASASHAGTINDIGLSVSSTALAKDATEASLAMSATGNQARELSKAYGGLKTKADVDRLLKSDEYAAFREESEFGVGESMGFLQNVLGDPRRAAGLGEESRSSARRAMAAMGSMQQLAKQLGVDVHQLRAGAFTSPDKDAIMRQVGKLEKSMMGGVESVRKSLEAGGDAGLSADAQKLLKSGFTEAQMGSLAEMQRLRASGKKEDLDRASQIAGQLGEAAGKVLGRDIDAKGFMEMFDPALKNIEEARDILGIGDPKERAKGLAEALGQGGRLTAATGRDRERVMTALSALSGNAELALSVGETGRGIRELAERKRVTLEGLFSGKAKLTEDEQSLVDLASRTKVRELVTARTAGELARGAQGVLESRKAEEAKKPATVTIQATNLIINPQQGGGAVGTTENASAVTPT
jgi:hypothetical protein